MEPPGVRGVRRRARQVPRAGIGFRDVLLKNVYETCYDVAGRLGTTRPSPSPSGSLCGPSSVYWTADLVSQITTEPEASMPEQSPIDIAKAQVTAYNDKNWDAVKEAVAPNVV